MGALRVGVELFLELFIEIFDEILIRLLHGTGYKARIGFLWLRNLWVKDEWFDLFELLPNKTWLSTDQSPRNLVIEHFEAELGSLGHLELLVILAKLYFLTFSGLNPIGNNFYHPIIFFFLLNSSHALILDFGVP